MRKNYIFRCALILLMIAIFAGCQANYYNAVLDELQSLFANEAKKIDIAASLNFGFNKQEQLSHPIANSWFQVMPAASSVDLALTINYNPSEVRITGHLSCLGELIQVFQDLGVGLDIDFDLYLNKDEGIFLKSDDGFAVTKDLAADWQPQLTADNWLQIGSAEEAQAFITSLKKLQDPAVIRPILESNIIEVNSKKEKDTYMVETDNNVMNIWQEIFNDQTLINSKLYTTVTDFFEATKWQATYRLNAEKELTDSAFVPSINSEQTNDISRIMNQIDGVIYRFVYDNPPEKSFRPVGEYR